jgi:type I restriction enzyme S subunit
MTDVDISNYKILQNGEFVFTPDTSRRGEKISLALNSEGQDVLVSKIYSVFRVKDHDELLPEFLLLWFKRAEFDRYARFHSWGSARETFNWEDMREVSLPVPPKGTQESIVAIYEVLETRMAISSKVQKIISPSAPILFAGIIQDIEKVS